jgi:signal transduction histidine kinase/PleD family two-component response regulator
MSMTIIGSPPKKDYIGILVVDDHPNTASTLARALSQLGPGVHVTSAVSGQEALAKVKDSSVDILITDMVMPEMTGLELIEKLQNHPGGKPLYNYLITAYDVPGLKVTAHRLNVNEVIVKPVRPERICQIATQAIEEMKQATRSPNKIAGGKRKFKILVADDISDNVALLVRYLEYEGYDQVIAMDGQEALNKVHDEQPDLVLLDVNMPNKDGFTVLAEIRADPAVMHIPVIILTAARLEPSDVQSGLNLGADDYVTKPFDRHELIARIRTKLRVKEAEDMIRRRNRELNLLPEIGKELSARLDVKDLANVLLKRTVETLGAVQGNMFILENETDVRENHQISLLSSETSNELKLSEKLIRLIQDTHQGLIIEDALSDPLWRKDSGASFRSAVIAPLHGRRSLLGLLVLTHEQEKYFNTDHLLLLQAIASQAAIAIENARLYTETMQEQKRLAAVLQHAAEAILLFDEQGKLSLINPAGEKLFTDFNAKLNRPLESGRGYDAFIELLEQARRSDRLKSGEIAWPDQRTFAALITPIGSGGLVAVLHDVTHFKNLERVKNEFISTVSHDLKNPIGVIEGFSELIPKIGPLNEEQAGFVRHIQAASRNMNELVQNLLQLSKMDMGVGFKKETVDVNALVSEINNEFQPHAKAKEQVLQFKRAETLLTTQGDPFQLCQALRNLVGNAIKYTPFKGSINLFAEANGDTAVIHIKDSGYGISTDDLPFIFDRFYRVRGNRSAEIEGNGLGLAIVKSIVEQHGGQIEVVSEPNKGSCFSVFLPLLAPVDITSPEPVAHISNTVRHEQPISTKGDSK